MAIAPTLNIPQAKFLAMQYKFKAYVAGFGSGKTWVGCGGICKGMWEHPKINQVTLRQRIRRSVTSFIPLLRKWPTTGG